MKKYILLLSLLFSVASAGEPIDYTQRQMMVPPTQPKHIGTKEYIDGQDEAEATVRADADTTINSRIDDIENGYVKYDEDGNITFQAGMDINTSIPQPPDPVTGDPVPPIVRTVLDTDSEGNLILGHPDGEVNIQASMRPTVKVGDDHEKTLAFQEDFQGYATEQYVDQSVANKADLVNGIIPDAQIPPHLTSKGWGPVATSSDLVTLTEATVNDHAFVGPDSNNIYQTWYLTALPPTTQDNWIQSGGGGGGASGIQSINGLTGPTVDLDLPNLPQVQNALDDTAKASDLNNYMPISGGTFHGWVSMGTPPITSNDTTLATTAFVNSVAGNYLAKTGGAMTGSISFSDRIQGINFYSTPSGASTPERTFSIYGNQNGINIFGNPSSTQRPIMALQLDGDVYKTLLNISNGDLNFCSNFATGETISVKTELNNRLKTTGGTISGNLTVNGSFNKITYGTSAPPATGTPGTIYIQY